MEKLKIVRKIDSVGRIVIPTELRNALNIEAQSEVEFIKTEDGILMKKI